MSSSGVKLIRVGGIALNEAHVVSIEARRAHDSHAMGTLVTTVNGKVFFELTPVSDFIKREFVER
jgi:hypothetical protein